MENEFHWAMDVTMHFIGGKWKTVVLWYLTKGRKRFSDLRKLIPNITEKMLSLQLKSLEADGIIVRKVYPEVLRELNIILLLLVKHWCQCFIR